MPKRLYRSTFRVDASEVQGEGAYVDFKRLTWDQFKTLLSAKDDQARKRVELSIVGWNWVDDDGNPLPDPAADKKILDRLNEQEALFLINHSLQGPDKDEEKNSGSAS